MAVVTAWVRKLVPVGEFGVVTLTDHGKWNAVVRGFRLEVVDDH
ncbi:hypothetical protein [Streptomyces violascens]|nr:hypothetical protein [Streptomyces violascens]GGU41193.1 hypothetical protein GCM10010289_72620 [Streptomyces violascens]